MPNVPDPVPYGTTPDLEDFDIEKWIKGYTAPTTTVPVTNKPGAGLELARLESEIAKIKRELKEATVPGGPKRSAGKRAGSAQSPQEIELRKQMRQILDELDGTWIEVELRALNPIESNKLGDDHPNRITRLGHALALAGSIKGKTLDADQWLSFLKAIGNAQTVKLENELDTISGAVVTPDFSERVSPLIDGQPS